VGGNQLRIHRWGGGAARGEKNGTLVMEPSREIQKKKKRQREIPLIEEKLGGREGKILLAVRSGVGGLLDVAGQGGIKESRGNAVAVDWPLEGAGRKGAICRPFGGLALAHTDRIKRRGPKQRRNIEKNRANTLERGKRKEECLSVPYPTGEKDSPTKIEPFIVEGRASSVTKEVGRVLEKRDGGHQRRDQHERC